MIRARSEARAGEAMMVVLVKMAIAKFLAAIERVMEI